MTSTSSTSSCWISSDSLTTISSTFADPENGTTTCSFGTFTAAESSLLSLLSSLPSESQSASSSSSTSTTTTLTTTAFDSSTSVTSLTSASISISSTNNSTTTANSTTSMAGILTLTDILSSLLPSLSLPESSPVPVQTPPVSPPPSPPTPTPAPTTVPEPISTLVPPAEPSSTPGLSPLPPETVSPTLGTTSVFTTLSSSGLIIPSPPLSPSITQLTTPAAFSAPSSTRVSRTTITARPSGTPAVTPNPTGSLFPSPGWPSGSAFARNPRAIAGLVVGLTIALLFAIAWVFLARRRRQQRALFRRPRQSHRPSVRSRHGIGVAIAESTESLYSRDSERMPFGSEVDPEMAERVSIDGSVGDRPEHYATTVPSPLTPFIPTMRTGLMEGEPGAGAGTGYSENGYSTSQRERVERSSSSLSTPFQPAVGGLTLTQAAAVIASSRSGEGSRSGQLGTSVGASSGSRSGGPGIAVPEPAVAGPSRSEGSLIPRAEPYAYQPRRHGSTSPYEPTTAHQEYVHVEDEPPSPSSSRSVVGRGLRGLIGRMSRRSAPPAMQRRRGPSLTIQVPVSGTGSGFPVVLLDGQEVEEHPFRRGLLTPGIESGTSFRDDFDYSTPIAGPVHNTSIAPSSVAPSTFGDRDSFG